MRVLVWLSLGYTAVLVVALATTLVLILVYLLRIRAALRPVAAALTEVAERTAPLGGVIEGIVNTLARVSEDARHAAADVVRAGEVLGIEPPKSPPAQAGAVARWQAGA